MIWPARLLWAMSAIAGAIGSVAWLAGGRGDITAFALGAAILLAPLAALCTAAALWSRTDALSWPRGLDHLYTAAWRLAAAGAAIGAVLAAVHGPALSAIVVHAGCAAIAWRARGWSPRRAAIGATVLPIAQLALFAGNAHLALTDAADTPAWLDVPMLVVMIGVALAACTAGSLLALADGSAAPPA